MKTKFTIAAINKLPVKDAAYEALIPEKPGLRVRVWPSGKKVFEVLKRPRGSRKVLRIKLCAVGELPLVSKTMTSVESLYFTTISQLLDGQNPNQQKRINAIQAEAEGITLYEAMLEYLDDIELSAGSVEAYKQHVDNHLTDWKDLPLSAITGDMCKQKFKQVAKKYPVAANNVMRTFRCIYNNARESREDLPECPTRFLRRIWTKERRRTGNVGVDDLRGWWEALETIPDMPADYFRFVIMTGLRRREATGLRWDNVNLKARTFTILKTKNKEPLTLPLSDYLVELLERRKADGTDVIFPIDNPIKLAIPVREACGLHFTIHDLRRSYITYCESLDFGLLTIKKLVNHLSSDVTSGYAQITVERLREPQQRVTDYILSHAGVKECEVKAINGTTPVIGSNLN